MANEPNVATQPATQTGRTAAIKLGFKGMIRNNYRKGGGVNVFVYELVNGKPGDKEAYKAAMEARGLKYNEDATTGNPLFFSPRGLGRSFTGLTITPNNTVVVDDVNQALDQDQKFNDMLLQERAKIIAARMYGAQGQRSTPTAFGAANEDLGGSAFEAEQP